MISSLSIVKDLSEKEKKVKRSNLSADTIESEWINGDKDRDIYVELIGQNIHLASLSWLEQYVNWITQPSYWSLLMKQKESERLHFNEVALGKGVSTLLLNVIERFAKQSNQCSDIEKLTFLNEQLDRVAQGVGEIVVKVLGDQMVSPLEKSNFLRVFFQNTIKKNPIFGGIWVSMIGDRVADACQENALWALPEERPLVFDLLHTISFTRIQNMLSKGLGVERLLSLHSSYYNKNMVQMILEKVGEEEWAFIEKNISVLPKGQKENLLNYVLEAASRSHEDDLDFKHERLEGLLDKMSISCGFLFEKVNEAHWKARLSEKHWAMVEKHILKQMLASPPIHKSQTKSMEGVVLRL